MKRDHAYKLRELLHKAAASLDDSDALDGVELFPVWAAGNAYAVNDRVRYHTSSTASGPPSPQGEGYALYKCVQAHTSQTGWEPDKTPALWTEVAKPGEIPVWKQPTGAQDAYAKGDKVRYPDENGAVYNSLVDSNVWPPDTPGLWEREEGEQT